MKKQSPKGGLATNDASKSGLIRTLSMMATRLQLAIRAGLQFDGERDLYAVFGYKVLLTCNDFVAKYQRQDIASRLVDAPPVATWSNSPKIEASPEFLKAWQDLVENHNIWNVMMMADKLSRLGRFSLILIGYSGGDAQSPITAGHVGVKRSVLYIRPVIENQVEEILFQADPTKATFGKPDIYKIAFDDPSTTSYKKGTISTKVGAQPFVTHASRCVHIVENPLTDMVFSTPIIEKTYNLLDDILKVAGGTAETYWLTSNRGMQADIDKDMELLPADAAALADEITEYQHELRRIIRTRGVKLTPLSSQPPDPSTVFNMLMDLLAGTAGIPKRILLGAEAGQLASEQDRANWAERIMERRTLHAEPFILRPTIKNLQNAGVLPQENVKYLWPEAFRMNPLERAQTMAARARAVTNLAGQTGSKTPMQITTQEEAREIIELEGALPTAKINQNDLVDQINPDDPNNPSAGDAGGVGKGKSARANLPPGSTSNDDDNANTAADDNTLAANITSIT